MNVEEIRAHYRKSLRSWYLFDFGLPVVLIMISWPIAKYLIGIDYAFEKIFSAADLVPIGAVLLLATSREIDIESRMGRIVEDLDLYKQLGLWIAIVFLLIYMALKYFSLTYNYPDGEEAKELSMVVSRLPYVSFSLLVCSFTFCFAAKKNMIASLKDGGPK